MYCNCKTNSTRIIIRATILRNNQTREQKFEGCNECGIPVGPVETTFYNSSKPYTEPTVYDQPQTYIVNASSYARDRIKYAKLEVE